MKQEILDKLREVESNFDYIEFDGDVFGSDTISKEVETENYLIVLEIELTVKFSDYREYEYEDATISSFEVYNQDSEIVISNETHVVIIQHFINLSITFFYQSNFFFWNNYIVKIK